MTFLDLQKKLVQTRKARKGMVNRTEYFEEGSNEEEFYSAVYKRVLSVANQIVKHYEELGEFDPKDKPSINWKAK